MKKSKFVMTVELDFSLDNADKVQFKFQQKDAFVKFVWPSTNAARVAGTNKINLTWSADDAFKLRGNEKVYMDTLISPKNSSTNPETEIVELYLKDTLFSKEEVKNS